MGLIDDVRAILPPEAQVEVTPNMLGPAPAILEAAGSELELPGGTLDYLGGDDVPDPFVVGIGTRTAVDDLGSQWLDAEDVAIAGGTSLRILTGPADSISEGHNTGGVRTLRWADLVQNAYRARRGLVGGPGYYPARYVSDIFPAAFTPAGTVGFDFSRGPGYRGANLAAGATMTSAVPMVGTVARVWFSAVAFGGILTASIDGGAPVDIPTAYGASDYRDRYQDVPTGGPGAHTIVIGRNGAGGFTPVFGGVQMLNGEEAGGGAQFVDVSHSGATTALYLSASTSISNPEDWALARNLGGTGAKPAHLAILAPFTNEVRLAGNTVAGAKANVAALIAQMRTAVTGVPGLPFLLVAQQLPAGWEVSAPWADYMDALRELADELDNVGLLDLHQYGPFVHREPIFSVPDVGLHPNVAGHATIASRIVDTLTPATPAEVLAVAEAHRPAGVRFVHYTIAA